MKKIIVMCCIICLCSCKNDKQILLPRFSKSEIKAMENHSEVYITFVKNHKDTLAKVNKNGTISSTNWVFNIDRRLPLRLVFPELIALQTKKDKSMHKSEETGNYIAYADTLGKNLAFIDFTKFVFKMKKPLNSSQTLIITKDSICKYQGQPITITSFINYRNPTKKLEILLDSNTTFENFIAVTIALEPKIQQNKEVVFYCN